MRYALSFSGGKDSTLALDRAVSQGLDIAYLFNIFEGSSERVRFHGIRAPLIAAQARELGIELIQDSTHPDDYEAVLLRVLRRLQRDGIGGIIFGNIHLADIRAWYEERVTALGFSYLEPLWGTPGPELLREFVERGYIARIVSIDLARTPEAWLGRTLDQSFIADVGGFPEIDPCGERGEYHTFVENGPLFGHPLTIDTGERVHMEGHALLEVTES